MLSLPFPDQVSYAKAIDQNSLGNAVAVLRKQIIVVMVELWITTRWTHAEELAPMLLAHVSSPAP